MDGDYLTAAEALGILGVRPQTLYAYVSRGWLKSIPQTGRRQRLYCRDDVDRLRTRSRARAGHGAVAAGAMHWGDPIISTAITEITPQGPRYRGYLALDLARKRQSFEGVSELLWTGLRHEEAIRWRLEPLPADVTQLLQATPVPSNDTLLEAFSLVVLALGMARGTIAERVQSGNTLPAARQVIQTLTGCFGYASSQGRFVPLQEGESIAEGLARALSISPNPENLEALEAILILLADHELSPGTFAAREAASAGSALQPCVVSGMLTTAGVHVGRLFDRVEDLLTGATSQEELLRQAREMGRRGSTPPGFSHPLYPKGDPRALYMLDLAQRWPRQIKQLAAICGFVEEAGAKLGLQPRQELGVVTLALAMGLPKRCAGALFVASRTAGWVAHVLEQRLTGSLLRPRARFIGG